MIELKNFQKKIGADPDGIFGNETLSLGAVYFGISKIEAIHFFAQIAHETGGFKVFKENLNYSSKGLLKVFKKYYPNEIESQKHHRKPELIANTVYSNRMGNGDFNSGDGWNFRGRGAIQLTGRNNYEDFFNSIGCCLDVELVSNELAFDSAYYFFMKNNIFKLCVNFNDNTIMKVSKKINGGYNGLSHRINLTKKYSKWAS